MPTPGNRAKAAKARNRRQAQAMRDAFVTDVDDADGWTSAVNILCAVFELPGKLYPAILAMPRPPKTSYTLDMTTRKGLKRIYAQFDSIYTKLDSAYQRNLQHERIRGGIVGIYAKMCVDSMLRNKLIEKGMHCPGH
ncbi:hypothetical protein NMY22_g18377 [Coprinellus aureogranulatus]|nr:hypothetical protein NMY22_g18377 [Coprinellus aureogranulatus]